VAPARRRVALSTTAVGTAVRVSPTASAQAPPPAPATPVSATLPIMMAAQPMSQAQAVGAVAARGSVSARAAWSVAPAVTHSDIEPSSEPAVDGAAPALAPALAPAPAPAPAPALAPVVTTEEAPPPERTPSRGRRLSQVQQSHLLASTMLASPLLAATLGVDAFRASSRSRSPAGRRASAEPSAAATSASAPTPAVPPLPLPASPDVPQRPSSPASGVGPTAPIGVASASSLSDAESVVHQPAANRAKVDSPGLTSMRLSPMEPSATATAVTTRAPPPSGTAVTGSVMDNVAPVLQAQVAGMTAVLFQTEEKLARLQALLSAAEAAALPLLQQRAAAIADPPSTARLPSHPITTAPLLPSPQADVRNVALPFRGEHDDAARPSSIHASAAAPRAVPHTPTALVADDMTTLVMDAGIITLSRPRRSSLAGLTPLPSPLPTSTVGASELASRSPSLASVSPARGRMVDASMQTEAGIGAGEALGGSSGADVQDGHSPTRPRPVTSAAPNDDAATLASRFVKHGSPGERSAMPSLSPYGSRPLPAGTTARYIRGGSPSGARAPRGGGADAHVGFSITTPARSAAADRASAAVSTPAMGTIGTGAIGGTSRGVVATAPRPGGTPTRTSRSRSPGGASYSSSTAVLSSAAGRASSTTRTSVARGTSPPPATYFNTAPSSGHSDAVGEGDNAAAADMLAQLSRLSTYRFTRGMRVAPPKRAASPSLGQSPSFPVRAASTVSAVGRGSPRSTSPRLASASYAFDGGEAGAQQQRAAGRASPSAAMAVWQRAGHAAAAGEEGVNMVREVEHESEESQPAPAPVDSSRTDVAPTPASARSGSPPRVASAVVVQRSTPRSATPSPPRDAGARGHGIGDGTGDVAAAAAARAVDGRSMSTHIDRIRLAREKAMRATPAAKDAALMARLPQVRVAELVPTRATSPTAGSATRPHPVAVPAPPQPHASAGAPRSGSPRSAAVTVVPSSRSSRARSPSAQVQSQPIGKATVTPARATSPASGELSRPHTVALSSPWHICSERAGVNIVHVASSSRCSSPWRFCRRSNHVWISREDAHAHRTAAHPVNRSHVTGNITTGCCCHSRLCWPC